MSGGKTAPTLSRTELHPQLVTDADAFTATRYLRQREEAPALWELEEQGEKQFPGTPGVLGDTYHSLWSEKPGLKPSDQVPPNRRYWREMLAGMQETGAFENLRAKTRGSALMSLAGTIEAGRTVLGLVPEGDSDKLDELEQAQQEAEEAEAAAQNAEAEVDALAQAIAQMKGQGQGKGDPASGSPPNSDGQGEMSAEQAQKLADKLAEAQASAESAREKADEKALEAEQKAEDLLGQPGSDKAEAKLRELARLGASAVKAAEQQVSNFSETIQFWGDEEGELSKMDPTEAFALIEKMSRFRSFMELLGKIRRIAAKKARSKIAGAGARIRRVETGRDLKRVVPSELVALAHPVAALQLKARMRWARGELRLHGEQIRERLGRGPVVVCEDASGSMDGAPQQWAKGVVLSLAHYAKLQRRGFGWVMFDSRVCDKGTFPGGRITAKDQLRIAEATAGGGTNFEAPLREALRMIREDGLKQADIVLVTDGDCAVSEEFLKELVATKRELELTIVTVICDAGGHCSDVTVKKFSDRVERASGFSAEEAEAKVFAHL